ncbi:PREDICTED: uncharacterized protein LOC106812526 [Priapulus caudatus]|uniref:Uncharacterized protein LOC106812526 n=1 Tax=Priapulus caudatus TaxID=37621 RepID=A0ABM1EI88_PRICU|nr:PREDICTED: uncharacterized protein LOC106812526 [Priapulus caudatus]
MNRGGENFRSRGFVRGFRGRYVPRGRGRGFSSNYVRGNPGGRARMTGPTGFPKLSDFSHPLLEEGDKSQVDRSRSKSPSCQDTPPFHEGGPQPFQFHDESVGPTTYVPHFGRGRGGPPGPHPNMRSRSRSISRGEDMARPRPYEKRSRSRSYSRRSRSRSRSYNRRSRSRSYNRRSKSRERSYKKRSTSRERPYNRRSRSRERLFNRRSRSRERSCNRRSRSLSRGKQSQIKIPDKRSATPSRSLSVSRRRSRSRSKSRSPMENRGRFEGYKTEKNASKLGHVPTADKVAEDIKNESLRITVGNDLYLDRTRGSALTRLGPPVATTDAYQYEGKIDQETREVFDEEGRCLLSSLYDSAELSSTSKPVENRNSDAVPWSKPTKDTESKEQKRRESSERSRRKARRSLSPGYQLADSPNNEKYKSSRERHLIAKRRKPERRRQRSRSGSTSSCSSVLSSSSWTSSSSSGSSRPSCPVQKKGTTKSSLAKPTAKPYAPPLKSCLKKKSLAIPLDEPNIPGAQVMDYGHGQVESAPHETWEGSPTNVVATDFGVPQNIEDEDEFLYGDEDSNNGNVESEQVVQSSMETLPSAAPEVKASMFHRAASYKQPVEEFVDHNRRRQHVPTETKSASYAAPVRGYASPSITQVTAQQIELKPEPPQEKGNVLQDILQSIGFNFELSKKNQEKDSSQKTPETFGIRESTSFLTGGLDAIIQESAFGKQTARSGYDASAAPQSEYPPASQQAFTRAVGYQPPVTQQPITVHTQQSSYNVEASQYQAYPTHTTYEYGSSQIAWHGQAKPVTSGPTHARTSTPAVIPQDRKQVKSIYEERDVGTAAVAPSTSAAQGLPEAQDPTQVVKLVKKREGYIKQFRNLQLEIINLKRQQGELLRRAQKQKDGRNDPLVQESTHLMEEIAKQMRSLHSNIDANGKALGLKNPLEGLKRITKGQAEVTKKEHGRNVKEEDGKQELEKRKDMRKWEKEEKERVEHQQKKIPTITSKEVSPEEKLSKQKAYEYFDPGEHWCKACNVITKDVNGLLRHLQSRQHAGNADGSYRPWRPEMMAKKKPQTKSRPIVEPFKGSEFLMPCPAFFCRICKVFSGDSACAVEHLQGRSHNLMYEKYLVDNPFYERRFDLDKAAGLAAFQAALAKEAEMREKLNQKKAQAAKERAERAEKERAEQESQSHYSRQYRKREAVSDAGKEDDTPPAKDKKTEPEPNRAGIKIMLKKDERKLSSKGSFPHDVSSGSDNDDIGINDNEGRPASRYRPYLDRDRQLSRQRQARNDRERDSRLNRERDRSDDHSRGQSDRSRSLNLGHSKHEVDKSPEKVEDKGAVGSKISIKLMTGKITASKNAPWADKFRNRAVASKAAAAATAASQANSKHLLKNRAGERNARLDTFLSVCKGENESKLPVVQEKVSQEKITQAVVSTISSAIVQAEPSSVASHVLNSPPVQFASVNAARSIPLPVNSKQHVTVTPPVFTPILQQPVAVTMPWSMPSAMPQVQPAWSPRIAFQYSQPNVLPKSQPEPAKVVATSPVDGNGDEPPPPGTELGMEQQPQWATTVREIVVQKPVHTVTSRQSRSAKQEAKMVVKAASPECEEVEDEPPPPGTEGGKEPDFLGRGILEQAGAEGIDVDDAASEGSGISMYMGSDMEVLDEVEEA